MDSRVAPIRAQGTTNMATAAKKTNQSVSVDLSFASSRDFDDVYEVHLLCVKYNDSV